MKSSMSSLLFAAIVSLQLASTAAAATPKFGDAKKSCMAFWETIALDTSTKDNKIASIITALEALQNEAGLTLPRQLLQRTETEIQMIMRAVSPVCQEFRLRAGDSDGDTPVWIDAANGKSFAYCPEGSSDNGNGFGTIDGHQCKVLPSIDATLVELEDVARRFQSLINRVEGDVLGNVKIAISDLEGKYATGQLDAAKTEKLEELKQKSVKFTDFWLMLNKAWQQLSSDAARLGRVYKGEDLAAQDALQCPAESCVFERNFCYLINKRHAIAYFEGEQWLWWGNGTAEVDATLSNIPKEFSSLLFRPGSRKITDPIPNSKLSMVTSPRGECKPEDIKGFNLKLTKVALPVPRPEDKEPPIRPNPNEDSTQPEINNGGAGCPNEVLAHGTSRWFELPVDGNNVIPGSVLKVCKNGAITITDARCEGAYRKDNNTCVMQGPQGGDQPSQPVRKDCDAEGLLDGESGDSDMPADAFGIPGKWVKQCREGKISIAGVSCHNGWRKQGNACLRDENQPEPQGDECKKFSLAEGESRFEDMFADNGQLSGKRQYMCVKGVLEKSFFCVAPYYRVGDNCQGGSGDGGSVPPPPGGDGQPGSDPGSDPGSIPGGDSGSIPGGPGGVGPGPIPGGPLDPMGGSPGHGGISLGTGGTIIGAVSQFVADLLNTLFQSGSLPNMIGQLFFQSGCLTTGSGCVATPGGGKIVLGPLGTLIDSISRVEIKVGGNALILSPNGKMILDVITGKPVVSGPFMLSGMPLTSGGSGNGPLLDLIGQFLNTGTPIGTVPASPAAPSNIDSATQQKPKFSSITWLKSLNMPGTGTARPDGVNIPGELGNGGSALKHCSVNGIVYRHGREWSQNGEAGRVYRYRCDNGAIKELGRNCQEAYTEIDGQCLRNCQDGGRSYRHGNQWDRVKGIYREYLVCNNGEAKVREYGCVDGYTKIGEQCLRNCQDHTGTYRHNQKWDRVNGTSVEYLICENGNPRIYDRGCTSGYSRDQQGQCHRDCGSQDKHGSYKQGSITNGTGNYQCWEGQWQFRNVASCNEGYTQSGNACVYVSKDCSWPLGGTVRNGYQQAANVPGGWANYQCNNGQLERVNAGCHQGYQQQATFFFPHISCVQERPKRACMDSHERMVQHGAYTNYPIQNGYVRAECVDGTWAARGLPVCNQGYKFDGNPFGALIFGGNNLRCVYILGSDI